MAESKSTADGYTGVVNFVPLLMELEVICSRRSIDMALLTELAPLLTYMGLSIGGQDHREKMLRPAP